jgi:putative ABC transport system substrate-binding protein
VKRREFITLLGGAAAAWPLAARAQADRVRRMGLLWPYDQNDPVGRSLVDAFKQGLAELGWIEGRNVRIDARWNPTTPEQTRIFVAELIELKPDILVTGTPRLTAAIQQQTKTIPIVFLGAGDPLAQGIVANLSHPGGQHHRRHGLVCGTRRQMAGISEGVRPQPHQSRARFQPRCDEKQTRRAEGIRS